MSLTRILKKQKHRGNIKNWFKHHFPNPGLDVNYEIMVEPSINTSAYTGDIGTALDYLIRFNLEYLNKNKFKSRSYWVAESAIEKIIEAIETSEKPKIAIGYYQDKIVNRKDFIELLNSEFLQAKDNYKSFIKIGKFNKSVIHSAIFLAKLDITYRTGIVDSDLDNIQDMQIKELEKILNLVPWNSFAAKKVCIANPSFGAGSSLVGGADADLIIDKTLIDIKSSKNLKLERSDLNQIIGYLLLSEYDKLQGNDGFEIDTIGIYFARFGYLWQYPIKNFGNLNYSELSEQFAKLVNDFELDLVPNNSPQTNYQNKNKSEPKFEYVIDKDDFKCPYCNSVSFQRQGQTSSGKYKYCCNECNRSFSSEIKTSADSEALKRLPDNLFD